MMHAVLLALLFVAPAFMDFEKKEEMIPVITLIPGKLIDEKLAGGGGSPQGAPQATAPANPRPAARSEPQPVSPPPPKVETPPPAPKVTKKAEPIEPEPEPARTVKRPDAEPTPVKPKKPVREEAPPKSNPLEDPAKERSERTPRKKPQIAPTFDQPSEAERARAAAKAKAEATAEAEAREREQQAQYNARVREVGDSLSQNLSTGTSIGPLGPGGEAYAYYGSVIVKIFDDAWILPNDVSDSDATVKAEVTIRRDGTVLSRQIRRRSGVSAVDASVQKALNRVLNVPKFPDGAKEDQRSFILNFNVKAKRLSG